MKNKERLIDMQSRYAVNGRLYRERLRKLLPSIMFSNLSILIILTIDSIIVGNFVQDKSSLGAMSVVSVIIMMFNTIAPFSAGGIIFRLSEQNATNDMVNVRRSLKAAAVLAVVIAGIICIAGYPITHLCIDNLCYTEELRAAAWQYTVGMMIAYPFSVITTAGTMVLLSEGKTTWVMLLTVLEGVTNLVMDLVLTAIVGMGVAGAGYGTMIASIVKFIAAMPILYIYLKKQGKLGWEKSVDLQEIKIQLSYAVPTVVAGAVTSVQYFVMIRLIGDNLQVDGLFSTAL
ncbi:MAG: MATE family efflux transporter [Eubacteriales bacterium]|nr:MATE family efflux transporter [Eubacteriales bacterium]